LCGFDRDAERSYLRSAYGLDEVARFAVVAFERTRDLVERVHRLRASRDGVVHDGAFPPFS
jgi:hypothetical protein